MSNRIDVKKTYKLYINGAFPRTESGRTYEIKSAKGVFVANPCLASRKDLRDAVVAARAAHSGWNKATAYNRGQICIVSLKCLKVDGRNLLMRSCSSPV